MSLNIVFISSGQYPNGGAASIRHQSIARGLSELGHKVSFILLSEQVEYKILDKTKGVKFNLIYNTSQYKVVRKIKKRLHGLKIKRAKTQIRKIHEIKSIDALSIFDIDPDIIEPLISFCRTLAIPVFHERTEYPFVVKGKTKNSDKKFEYYLNHTINQFDGIYVINDALVKYFQKKTNSKVSIKKILMTVEPDRFEKDNSNSPFNFEYLAYCGSMYGDKDGVPILIKAFSLIQNYWLELKLVLIGDTSNSKKLEKIKELIFSLNLQDRVIFTGKVKSYEMPKYLNHAKVLCLARPNNKQAEGGFPTKLGEYLSTKKPVAITNVGEITNYLKDGVHAFIAEPDSESSFAKKLNYILKNYDLAIKVGHKGFELVQNVFNYKIQAKELARFFINKK